MELSSLLSLLLSHIFQIKFKFGLTMMVMEVPSQPGLNPKRCLRLA